MIYKAVVFMLLHASLWIENKTLPFAYKMKALLTKRLIKTFFL